MKQFVLRLTPLLLCAQFPDRVPELVESMRESTSAGEQAVSAGYKEDTGVAASTASKDIRAAIQRSIVLLDRDGETE
jgi:hypothetical protein